MDSVNLTLDALQPVLYRKITGGEVSAVHSGIMAAWEGIPRIKLNCVLMRRINEGEIWPLIHFAADVELPDPLYRIDAGLENGCPDGREFSLCA